MSFITKGLKKAWKFVKKNWKTIALVAAVAFTAGVATVGFAAFSGVGTIGGFMSAVGQTMWAGVAATAGSMGIGAGATVPTTAATIAAGTAGTQVGLGAAWGAGGGFGFGAAGKAAEAAALEAAASAPTTTLGFLEKAAAEDALKKAGIELSKKGLEKATVDVAEKGLSDAAWKAMGVAAPIAGAALTALGQPREYRDVPIWGAEKGAPATEGVNYLAGPDGTSADDYLFDPGETALASQGAPTGDMSANTLVKGQSLKASESIVRPLMPGAPVTGEFNPLVNNPEDMMNRGTGLMPRLGANYG